MTQVPAMEKRINLLAHTGSISPPPIIRRAIQLRSQFRAAELTISFLSRCKRGGTPLLTQARNTGRSGEAAQMPQEERHPSPDERSDPRKKAWEQLHLVCSQFPDHKYPPECAARP